MKVRNPEVDELFSRNPYLKILIDVYENAYVVRSGEHLTTVNELTDQVPATRPMVLMSAVKALMYMGPVLGNKVLSEEDKGSALAGLFSTTAYLPLAMARRYNYVVPGSITVPLKSEYMQGHLVVNGIQPEDKIVLVDDTLATGGTIISLAEAVRFVEAEIVDVRVVVEKLDMGGRVRIKSQLGLDVKAAIGIRLESSSLLRYGVSRVTVQEVMGLPVNGVEQ